MKIFFSICSWHKLIIGSLIFISSCSLYNKPLSTKNINPGSASNDLPEAIILNEKGDRLFLSKNYDKAFLHYQKALTLRKDFLGNNSLLLIDSLNNLATVHEVKKQYIEAIKLYRDALKLTIRFSDNSVSETHTKALRGNIAVLFAARKILGKSKNSAHQSAATYQNFTKGKHPFYGVVLHQLAGFYWRENNLTRTSPYFEKAIEISEQNMGKEHPYLALILEDYATFLGLHYKETDVTDLQQRASQIRKKHPKKQHSPPYQQRKFLSN